MSELFSNNVQRIVANAAGRFRGVMPIAMFEQLYYFTGVVYANHEEKLIASSLTFSYAELAQLTSDELLIELSAAVRKRIIEIAKSSGILASNTELSSFFKRSPINVFVHEMEHARKLSQLFPEIAQELEIYLVLLQSGSELKIAGTTRNPTVDMSPMQRIQIALAPTIPETSDFDIATRALFSSRINQEDATLLLELLDTKKRQKITQPQREAIKMFEQELLKRIES